MTYIVKKLLTLFLWCLLAGGLSAQNLTLQAPMVTGNPGDTVVVPIQAINFTDMVSLQYSVNWDTSVVQFVSTTNFNTTLGVVPTSFGLTQTADGRLGFSWDDINIQGVTLPGTVTFFDLELRITGNPGDSSLVDFGNVPTAIFAAQFANGTFPTVNVDSVPGKVTVLGAVNPCANFAITATGTDPSCGQANGAIGVNIAGGAAPFSYNWSDGDTSSARTGLLPGTYQVIVTDSAACSDTASVVLNNQGNPPVPAFSTSMTNLTVTFTDASTNTPSAWLWDFGDGNVSLQQNPSHTYANAGTYTVCLTISNACGTDSSCSAVTVTAAPPANNLTVLANMVSGNPGDTVKVKVGALSFTDLVSLQFSNNWDTTKIRFTGTQNYNTTLGIMPINFGTNQAGSGQLGFSWDDANVQGVTLPDTVFMFDICFEIVGTPGDTATVGFGSTPTTIFAAQFAGGTFPTVQVDSLPGKVAILSTVNPCANFDVTLSATDPTCGLGDGSITATPTGGTAPYSYAWSDGDTTNPRTGLLPGTYLLTVTDSNSCVDTASVTLINQGVTPVAAFTPATLGLSAAFVDNSSGPPSSWLWDFGDGTTSTQQNPTHTYTASGTYTVCLTVSNACGTDSSCQALSFNCVPNWNPNNTGVSHNIIIPNTTPLLINGQPIPLGYYLGVFYTDQNNQLQNGGFVVWNGSSTSMTVSGDDSTTPNVKEGFATGETFIWKVYEPCGCEYFADSVSYAPTGGLITHTDQFASNGISQLGSLNASRVTATTTTTDACFGNPVNGTATVTPSSGCGGYQILWDTPNLDTTFTVTGLTPGFHRFVLTDSCGCSYIDSVDVMQGNPPIAFITASPSDTFCLGDTVTLTAVGDSFVVYQWSGPAGTPNLNQKQIQVTNPGLYTLFAIDSCGATATSFIFLVQKPLPQPTITASPDTVFCPGDSVILSAQGNYTAYRWYDASAPTMLLSNAPQLTVLNAGTYVVEVDSNGCTGVDTIVITQHPLPVVDITASPNTSFCPGDMVTLDATPGFVTYLWSTGDTTASIMTGLPGTYDVTVADSNGCMAMANISLIQFPQPTVQIVALPDSNFCPGDSVLLLTNPGNFVGYQWSTGDTTASLTVRQPGNIIVTVTDVNGCSATDSIQINQYPQPVVDIVGDTAFCSGDSVVLSTNPANFTDYNWSTGALTPSITVTSGGTYSVQVTDANGCVAADTVIVTENTLPGVNITASPDTAFCPGDIVTLSATPGLVSYLWSTGDTTNSIQTGQPGGYTVAVTDGNGCVGTDSITLVQYPQPSVQIVALPDSNFCPGDSVLLLTNPGNFASYLWSTGDTTASLTVKSARKHHCDGHRCEWLLGY
jgi:PKD repeat protein